MILIKFHLQIGNSRVLQNMPHLQKSNCVVIRDFISGHYIMFWMHQAHPNPFVTAKSHSARQEIPRLFMVPQGSSPC